MCSSAEGTRHRWRGRVVSHCHHGRCIEVDRVYISMSVSPLTRHSSAREPPSCCLPVPCDHVMRRSAESAAGGTRTSAVGRDNGHVSAGNEGTGLSEWRQSTVTSLRTYPKRAVRARPASLRAEGVGAHLPTLRPSRTRDTRACAAFCGTAAVERGEARA